MKKQKKFALKTMTDIKVFLLFLLDNIRYPIDHGSLIGLVAENTDEITFNYDESLRELVESGHIYFDEVDGEKYYMISESGTAVAVELYDTLDKDFRENSMRYAAKYLSVSRSGAKIESYVRPTENGRYTVTMKITDARGELMNVTLTVNSLEEAEKIKSNFESKPDGLYRGVLFSATGNFNFFS